MSTKGTPMNHCKPTAIRKPTKFGPKLIGYRCLVHGEIFTPTMRVSEPETFNNGGQWAAPAKAFPNKKHLERVHFAWAVKP